MIEKIFKTLLVQNKFKLSANNMGIQFDKIYYIFWQIFIFS